MPSTSAYVIMCGFVVATASAFYVPQSMRAGVKGYESRLTRRSSDVIESDTAGPIDWLLNVFNPQKRNEYNRNCFFSPMNCQFAYADAHEHDPSRPSSSELRDVKVILIDEPKKESTNEQKARPKCPRPALGFIRRRSC
ncbi:hypothetical protein AAVH_22257 [Aphelenchoides avenae]|nr:hypothetical protein AAVH_22257 [Aphelenchus avenae]